jgi:hypothetical protein
VLEAVSAGVPMVTWLRYGDQFHNEKLMVEVLEVGVSVGARDSAAAIDTHEVISGEVIAASINKLMEDSEEGNALRKKVQELRTMATKALEKGGSSYNDVGRLMDELMARCTRKRPGQLMDSDLTVLLNFMCFRTFELSGIVFFFKERQKVCLNSLIEKSRKFDSQDFSVTTLPWAKKITLPL